MARHKRNADGRLPVEALIGKTIRDIRSTYNELGFLAVEFLDSKGKVLFRAGPYAIFDERGMFFHHDNLENQP